MAVVREVDGMRAKSYTNEWWAPKYVWEDIDLPSQVGTPGAEPGVGRVREAVSRGGKMKSTTEMVEEAKEIDVQDAYGRFHSVRFETMHGSSPGLRAVFS